MRKSGYLLIFSVLVIYLISCKTEVQETIPKTEIELIVTDDKGNLLNGAKVAVFNSQTLYTQSLPNYTTEGAVVVDSTINGVVRFSDLGSKDKYNISIHYRDYSRVQGTYIDLDNSSQHFLVADNLVDGSLSKAKLSLKPANGLLTFWCNAESNAQLPFDINIENLYTGSITQTLATDPAPFQNGALSFHVKNGAFKYNVKTKSGCIYTGTDLIEGGSSKNILLTGCNIGKIAFWTSNNQSSSLPIMIILGQNDTLGVINNIFTSNPDDCNTTGLLFANRIPGEYSYSAFSQSTGQTWIGKFTLLKDDCKVLKIE